LQVVQFSERSTSDLGPLFAEYGFGRYCHDRFLDIRQSRRLEHDRALAFLRLNPTSSWLAVDVGKSQGILGMRISQWDTEFWGVKFATLDHLVTLGSEPERRVVCEHLLRTADAWCEQLDVDFCSARIDGHDVTSLQMLESHGFRYIETTVENYVDLRRKEAAFLPRSSSLRPPRPDEGNSLVTIAQDAFLSHRFYADDRFPRHKVDDMYRLWVENSLRDPEWKTLVLEADGAVRGFITYRIEDLTSYFGLQFAKWRMAALSKSNRGLGYGVVLFRGAMESVRGQVQIVDSGLTTRNLHSLNLHTKVGFRTACCSVTLHRWQHEP